MCAAGEAMPAGKYAFVPDQGASTGVRTFELNAKPVATTNKVFYSAILGWALAPGITVAGAANGPNDITTKEQTLVLPETFVRART